MGRSRERLRPSEGGSRESLEAPLSLILEHIIAFDFGAKMIGMSPRRHPSSAIHKRDIALGGVFGGQP
jgi:hypothetical protein